MAYGERHTRQGAARGQRWGTLDRDDGGVPHGMDESRAATRHSAMNARDGARKRDPELRTISIGGCWCGQPYGHDWLGRDQGAPHPRA